MILLGSCHPYFVSSLHVDPLVGSALRNIVLLVDFFRYFVRNLDVV